MINAILGKKISQSQKFLSDGTRIPVTQVQAGGNAVVSIKTKEKNGYDSIQLGFGLKKHPGKALIGHIKGANIEKVPLFLREIRQDGISSDQFPKLGDVIKITEVFKPGDIIDVIGTSKGKGYAGVVKRHHFKGGPRTHGQSDRERVPGSIGQTTTPGRVYKGKRMAGRMGHERVTVKNLKIIDVTEDSIMIKGLVPGGKNNMIIVKKIGEDRKFVPLYQEEAKETKEAEATKETTTMEVAQETHSASSLPGQAEVSKKTEEIKTKEEVKETENAN